jgi:TonB family protein
MTRTGLLILACVLLAACATADRVAEREYDIKQDIDRIPIQAAPTSPEARAAMRRDGQPVMLVKATPALLYRDYQRTEGSIRQRVHYAQEVPDVQGCVVVSYDVRPDGKTDGFTVEKSEPPGVFDRAALRAAVATEYEPATGPRPRQRRAVWFIVARPPRADFSKLNDTIEAERNRERDEQRAACEGPAA